MPKLFIRTNAGQHTGIGHLVRCLQLAKALSKQGAEVVMVLDYLEPAITPFLADVASLALYDKIQPQLDSDTDARLFSELLQQHQPCAVILDDYRLGKDWERAITGQQVLLCVIDDMLRRHQCDLLIDMKWRGDATAHSYDALIPKHTEKLLGPDYVMLSEPYARHNKQNTADIHDSFNIMIGIGGGGDLERCQQIIDVLLANQHRFDSAISITPVLGPLACNGEQLCTRYQHEPKVKPLLGQTELYPYLAQSHLYIGAAGGTLYQLLAMQIPALTFAIADNQQSRQQDLDDIGHFFHLPALSPQDIELLPSFAVTVQQHYPRIKQMQAQARRRIDGLGVERIVSRLLARIDVATPTTVAAQEQDLIQQPHNTSRDSGMALSAQHQLYPVSDLHINHYLASRNLAANSKNMIQTAPIPALSHYCWWFNSQRESFLLEKQQQRCLYIWHELKTLEQSQYLIGGWFVCHETVGFDDALLALTWQLEHCRQQYPQATWLAVIHRDNKFVKLLNQYLGFRDITPEHANGTAIATLFPQASFSEFYFVEYPASTNPDSSNESE